MFISQDTFLKIPAQEVANLIESHKRPRLGIFVPDGSRRLVVSLTNITSSNDNFYRLSAQLPAQHLLDSLQVFFSHGLSILLVPILSNSVLNRGENYARLTALTGLELLFASDTWSEFYRQYDICVRTYGNLSTLVGTVCEPALDWIETTKQQTAENRSHTLFFAIGESPILGDGIAEMGLNYFQANGRLPTLQEQIEHYYGELLPPADFFIMTSKMSGMGALPRFLTNGDTEIYFLPSAGAVGLNIHTWRLILYDLLFERISLQGDYVQKDTTTEDRAALRSYYQKNEKTVIGLGQKIGQTWVINT